MKTITTHYLQAHIGEMVEALIRGEGILLTRRGKELGRIVPLKSKDNLPICVHAKASQVTDEDGEENLHCPDCQMHIPTYALEYF